MKLVNRIITAVIAAVTFPVFLTQTFFSAVLAIDENSSVNLILSLFMGKDNALVNNRLRITETVPELYKMFTGKSDIPVDIDFKSALASLPAEFTPVKRFAAAALVFIVIGLLIALIIIGCAIFTRAYKTMIGLSLGGAVSFLASVLLFKGVEKPFIEGKIDVAKTLADIIITSDSELVKFGASFLTGAIRVDSCALSSAVFGAMIVMFAVAVWEAAYYFTIPEEEKALLKAKKA